MCQAATKRQQEQQQQQQQGGGLNFDFFLVFFFFDSGNLLLLCKYIPYPTCPRVHIDSPSLRDKQTETTESRERERERYSIGLVCVHVFLLLLLTTVSWSSRFKHIIHRLIWCACIFWDRLFGGGNEDMTGRIVLMTMDGMDVCETLAASLCVGY
jgi:hypothetical protein